MAASLTMNYEYPEEDDLPIGIFPEGHLESCYHALRQQGFACTLLNAELFYEINQIGFLTLAIFFLY